LKVVFHGWKSNYTNPVDQLIKNGYLDERRMDVNVIAVDWSEIAADNTYFFAARDTEAVGIYVANVLERLLLEKQVTLADIHLVGHSLGAHAAGATGENMKSGKLDRISGRCIQGPYKEVGFFPRSPSTLGAPHHHDLFFLKNFG
jgi:pimeloyl-ACP methyl ester carboxylesterase